MGSLGTQIKVTIGLGVSALCVGLVTLLALTDIYHGEADLVLEWNVVRVCVLLWLAFSSMALLTLGRALKMLS